MRVLVSGSRGLIGAGVVSALKSAGHEVLRLVREKRGTSSTEMQWDPATGIADAKSLEGIDAVIHLAGENIAGGRWTPARKAAIRDSRVRGTLGLVEAFLALERPPSVFLCASAIGYYGDTGDAVVDESSAAGRVFLADVCQAWEAVTSPLVERGVRVVNLRFGVVLSAQGGTLQKLLLPFRLGLGGVVGSGRQYFSWITLEDALGAVMLALTDDSARGPLNVVAPGAVSNAEFTKALGSALKRPTLLPLPAFAARLALGEMADALLLASIRVAPTRLIELGYEFKHPDIDGALAALLRK